ncbi:hypothetical protein ACFL0P_06805 [Candidatus Omnitrophota bacterium]
MKNHKSHILKVKAISVIAIVLLLVIGLIAANMVLARKETDFEYNKFTGWYPLKNMDKEVFQGNDNQYVISTDEFGHRNHLKYPPDGKLEYVVQGDSNIFGFGLRYKDTFCYKLNQLTKNAFYNFGIKGFDINNYYFQYKYFANKFMIKNRVIVFNIGNDFTLAMYSTPYLIGRPYLYVDKGTVKEVSDNTNRIKKQIYGYKFIEKYKEYNHLVEFLSIGRDWGDRCPKWIEKIPLVFFITDKFYSRIYETIACWMYPKDKKVKAKLLSPYYPSWLLLKQELWPEPYKYYTGDFERILRHIKNQNENICIVLLPMRSQIVDESFEEAKSKLIKNGYRKEDIDRLSFNRYMSNICLRNNIKLIDCTANLHSYQIPKDLYQIDNAHLSIKGIEICARALAKELRLFESQGR